MLKKHIKYTTFLGEEVEEDRYFHLTERELANLELKNEGGFEGLVRAMIETTDIPKLTALFEEIVLASYGELSADGKTFHKRNGELARDFVDSSAYDALYTELIGDANKLAEFINGIIPDKLQAKVNSPEAQQKIEELKKQYGIADHMKKQNK